MSRPAPRFSVAERLGANSSSSSRRSRCSSSRWRRRNSSSAVRNASAIVGSRRCSRASAGGGVAKPIASRPTRSPPCASGSSSAARGARAGAARSGICRSASGTNVGVPPANASRDERALAGAGRPRIGPAARRGRSPRSPAVTPLRGLCSKSSEHEPPGDVERVLVQLRQHVDQARVRASSEIRPGVAARAGAAIRAGQAVSARAAWPACGSCRGVNGVGAFSGDLRHRLATRSHARGSDCSAHRAGTLTPVDAESPRRSDRDI